LAAYNFWAIPGRDEFKRPGQWARRWLPEQTTAMTPRGKLIVTSCRTDELTGLKPMLYETRAFLDKKLVSLCAFPGRKHLGCFTMIVLLQPLYSLVSRPENDTSLFSKTQENRKELGTKINIFDVNCGRKMLMHYFYSEYKSKGFV